MNSDLPCDTLQRRVRHITAIQIRNLTPFPARDTLASALTQPAEESQFTCHGHFSDDMDITLSRRRRRRISTNSAVMQRTLRSSDAPGDEAIPKPSPSRVSFSERGDRSRHNSTTGFTSTSRPLRPRTISMGSSGTSHASISISPSSSLSGGSGRGGAPFSAISYANSQSGLEKIIQSRLVETFLAITISQTSRPTNTSLSRERSYTFQSHKASESRISRNQTPAVKMKTIKPISPSGFLSKLHVPPSDGCVNGGSKHASSQALSPPQDVSLMAGPSSPTYFTSIHRPSTNPYFSIDIGSNIEDHRVDMSGQTIKIEVWGKVSDPPQLGRLRRKRNDGEEFQDLLAEWRVLHEWDVNLENLVPLSDDLASHPSRLPANSLFVTMLPSGKTFHLPSDPPATEHPPLSGGYASDPESEVRRVKSPDVGNRNDGVQVAFFPHERHGGEVETLPLSRGAMTATYQELFRLANLQSCILDNKKSLYMVQGGIEKMLKPGDTMMRRHEISEREAHLEDLTADYKKVVEESNQLREKVDARAKHLQERKRTLALARVQLQQEGDVQHKTAARIWQNSAGYQSLQQRLGPIRTTLLSILSWIFPIELSSPPDLLYTILDIPLPIPLASSDPAPPLTLSRHKEVTEEAIATSLGYVAQVVHLLAGYLGKALVYPVTCIGSRSLIRDEISAMVGPRMFPLYSRGVDAYRFEYGVFLLNKDIELLMADRDLRALDMRHTLPNLKNLLLTLTNGEGAPLRLSRPPDSPMSMNSNIEACDTSVESGPGPNTLATEGSDLSLEGSTTTPPASGSNTPTATVTDGSKKPRPFLSLPPLTGFFRMRHPSSSDDPEAGPGGPVTETDEQAGHDDEGDDDDDEDRRTISNIPRDLDARSRNRNGSGLALNVQDGGDEKLRHENRGDISPISLDPLIHN